MYKLGRTHFSRESPAAPGVGKSNVSRYWQQAGYKFIDEFRGRDISSQNWVALMLDGIRLSKDQLIVENKDTSIDQVILA